MRSLWQYQRKDCFIILQTSQSCGAGLFAFSREGRNGKRHFACAGSLREHSRQQIAHKLTRTVCRVSDSKSAEHKKSSSEAIWIFCMEPICFGIIKGEQPLIRASRASKVAGAFLVLFWHAKENVPGGEKFCKSHPACPTRKRPAREANHQKPFCWL